MESLSRQLNKLLIGVLLLAVPVEAYIPKEKFYPTYVDPALVAKFKAGHTIPYDDFYVRRVVVGKAKIMPNGAIINLPYGPEFVPSFHDLQHDPKWQVKKPSPEFSADNINLNLDMSSPDFYWNERERRLVDLFFWTTQILDVYSTYKGMKYDCLTEANPLLPEVPEIPEMIGLKLGIIGGLKFVLDGDDNFWYGWKLGAGVSTGVVVANNFRLIRKAEKQCSKR